MPIVYWTILLTQMFVKGENLRLSSYHNKLKFEREREENGHVLPGYGLASPRGFLSN